MLCIHSIDPGMGVDLVGWLVSCLFVCLKTVDSKVSFRFRYSKLVCGFVDGEVK